MRLSRGKVCNFSDSWKCTRLQQSGCNLLLLHLPGVSSCQVANRQRNFTIHVSTVWISLGLLTVLAALRDNSSSLNKCIMYKRKFKKTYLFAQCQWQTLQVTGLTYLLTYLLIVTVIIVVIVFYYLCYFVSFQVLRYQLIKALRLEDNDSCSSRKTGDGRWGKIGRSASSGRTTKGVARCKLTQ